MTSDCDSHGDTIRYRCSHYQQGRKDGYAAALRDAVEAVRATYALSWCGDRFNQCDDYEHACQERKQTVAAIEALDNHSII